MGSGVRRALFVLAAVLIAALVTARASADRAQPRDVVPAAFGLAGRALEVRSGGELGRAAGSLQLGAARGDSAEDEETESGGRLPGSGSLRGLLYPALMLGLVFFALTRGGGGAGASLGGSGPMSYYAFWILAPMVASFVAARPAVLLIAPVALVLRRWLPDPWVLLRDLGRVRALQSAVAANSANVTARRDLAKIWLAQGRGKRALPVLAEAIARDPDSAELRWLHGCCLLQAGEPARALDAFLEVVHLDAGVAQGEAYLRAGDALIALARWDDAEDALDRFLDVQGSSVEGWYKLARVHRGRRDRDGARRALERARACFGGAPGFHRRRQLGWYLRARVLGLLA